MVTSSRPGVRRFHVTERREAMEVRADNLDDVAAWCGGEAARAHWSRDVGMVIVRSGGNDEVARIGGVLVRDGDGRYRGYGREEFERVAAQWEETT